MNKRQRRLVNLRWYCDLAIEAARLQRRRVLEGDASRHDVDFYVLSVWRLVELARQAHDNAVQGAGYTRGALYHQFANKEDLALAVVAWVEQTWYAQMAPLIADDADPVGALIAVARGHAVYCRRDVARVVMTLRVEFSGQDHPVGRAVEEAGRRVVADCARLITAGRRKGAIPPGSPPRVLALAVVGALEGLVINLAGQAPFDELLAERVVVGLLGLPPAPASGSL